MELMNKSTAFWMGLACFAAGVVWGFLLSPIKKGVTVYACNNGSGNNGNGKNNRVREEENKESLNFSL